AGEQLDQVASLDAALDGGFGDAGDKRQLAALIQRPNTYPYRAKVPALLV
ncbi:hypothetical protein HT105_22490, partial [Bacteroides fragilis]|nr:hypothetical protein [Bacteroides fragilis]